MLHVADLWTDSIVGCQPGAYLAQGYYCVAAVSLEPSINRSRVLRANHSATRPGQLPIFFFGKKNQLLIFLPVPFEYDLEKLTFTADAKFYNVVALTENSDVDETCRNELTGEKLSYIGTTNKFETIEAIIVRIRWDFDLRVKGKTKTSEGSYLRLYNMKTAILVCNVFDNLIVHISLHFTLCIQ